MASTRQHEIVTRYSTSRRGPVDDEYDDKRIAEETNYKSGITPRKVNVSTRGALSTPGHLGSSMYTTSTSTTSNLFGAPGNIDLGGMGGGATTSPATVIQGREKEKRDLQELNDRFANYIDRVRFLEGQNKKLMQEIAGYREKLEKVSANVKAQFETELRQARQLIDDTTKDKARIEIKCNKLEDDIKDYKNKYDDLLQVRNNEKDRLSKLDLLISEKDQELGGLQNTFDNLEGDIDRYKKEIAKLTGELANLKVTNEEEMLLRVDLENRLQSLQEELDFQTQLHQQEVKELMDNLMRDEVTEYRKIFRTELENALKDIRTEYDMLAKLKPDNEAWYKTRLQEIINLSSRKGQDSQEAKDEEKKARQRIADLNEAISKIKGENGNLEARVRELENLIESESRNFAATLSQRDTEIQEMQQKIAAQLFELKELMDTKLRLDLEIAAYRRLLEGEESRLEMSQEETSMMQRVRGSGYSSSSMTPSQMKISSSESSTRTSFQRSSKGPVSIAECSPEGKFILLENTSKLKDVTMDSWHMKRDIDGKQEFVYSFPSKFVLKAGRTVKVWARGHGDNRPPTDLVWSDRDSWGNGMNIITTLYTDKGEEKASHIARSRESGEMPLGLSSSSSYKSTITTTEQRTLDA